jgi:hypothetical protein
MAEAPNKGRPWTDTDDAVLLTFDPAEAAEMLGRSLQAVYVRRSKVSVSRENINRKPRQHLRREYFQANSQGRRWDAKLPRERSKCRFCDNPDHEHGLCVKCFGWVKRLVDSGAVTWEQARECWLLPNRYT